MPVIAKKGLPPEVQKRIREMYWNGYRQGELDALNAVLDAIRTDHADAEQLEVVAEALIKALQEAKDE